MAFYRKNPFEKYLTKEDRLHIAVVNYCKLKHSDKMCVHVPNEGKRTPFERWKVKVMGITKGFPDLIFPFQRERIINNKVVVSCGLAIELKVIYANGSRNKASKDQERVLIDLNKNGWETHVIWDFEAAIKVINEYFSLK